MTSVARDQPLRDRATSPAESFIVRAPAGSGKTELLIQRLLQLLATVSDPEEVLAITFTNKAAAEMQQRVLAALALARGGTAPEQPSKRRTFELACAVLARDAERGWELEQNPVRLRVQTIDSLCARLTRQMPVLARLGAQPQTLEDATPLYREAAAATLAELEQSGEWSDAIALLLDHLDNNLPRIRDLIADMLRRRDQWLGHVSDPDRAALEAALRHLVESTLAGLVTALPGAAAAELPELLDYAAANLAEAGSESPVRAWQGVTRLPDAVAENLPLWQAAAGLLLTGKREFRRKLDVRQGFPPAGRGADAERRAAMKQRGQDLLEALGDDELLRTRLIEVQYLPPAQYHDGDWAVVEALCRLLRLADGQLTVLFAEHNRIDFTGITRAAITALGDDEAPSDLALSLDYAIRHVLVDEFQDISAQQYRLLTRLTAGWTRDDGRTLFLVGDPMQSIYRFREAEVGLFLDTWERRRLGQVPLVPLNITVNFRSRRGVVEWVNDTFRQVLPQAPDIARGAVAFEQAEPFHDAGAEPAVVLHALPAGERAAEAEAAIVARLIADAQHADAGCRIGVLVRNRSVLKEIVPRLRRDGLKFRALDIEELGHRPAIQDLMALTRALCLPADQLAWFALLRAPWCALSLSDLLLLGEARGASTLWECLADAARLARLSARGRLAAGRVRAALAPVLEQAGRRRFRRWVESAWLRLGGPATLIDVSDLENARSYFELLDEMDANGELDNLDRLAERTRQLYAAADADAPEQLQIMTIHRAKGLEFDVVIVPALARGRRRDDPALLCWAQRAGADGSRELLLAPIRETGADNSPIYDCLQYFEKEKQEYEEARLLYVAATRARERLHLLALLNTDADGQVTQPRADSFLRLLWPARGADFEAALAAAGAGLPERAAAQPAAGRLWRRLPRDWQLPAPEHAAAQVPPPLVQAPPPGDELEFAWAGATIQHIGTVYHRCMRLLAEGGAEPGALRTWQESLLRDLGVPAAEIAGAADEVDRALRNTLEDERGRWLLDPGHVAAESEYALSGLHRGALSNVVLDRSFVAADGTRWIVDYKTSRHEGGALDAFLDQEQQRYRAQLEKYAAILSGLDARPIRLGLYFPLLGQWREWAWDGDGKKERPG